MIGNYLEISEQTVRRWRYDFYRSYGKNLQDNRGSYCRSNVITDEDISDRATAWLRKATSNNLTTARFTRWMNDDLIPSLPQPHDYSTISADTARRWLNKLGCEFSKFKREYTLMVMSEQMLLPTGTNSYRRIKF